MIFWDNFDSRSTEVFCDECEQNITHAARKAIRPKSLAERWYRKVISLGTHGYARDICELNSQRSFTIFGRQFVLTIFKVHPYDPVVNRFDKYKNPQQWFSSRTRKAGARG